VQDCADFFGSPCTRKPAEIAGRRFFLELTVWRQSGVVVAGDGDVVIVVTVRDAPSAMSTVGQRVLRTITLNAIQPDRSVRLQTVRVEQVLPVQRLTSPTANVIIISYKFLKR